ncbi:hypothetical protein GCK32_001871 [Trichostrongylus colubriformis]|uniref:ShKT domain-containing protein n=1 Tax=Trichostrongylus colubriformis TaxID=6319 RepID=A0AAN8FVH7_TRICO
MVPSRHLGQHVIISNPNRDVSPMQKEAPIAHSAAYLQGLTRIAFLYNHNSRLMILFAAARCISSTNVPPVIVCNDIDGASGNEENATQSIDNWEEVEGSCQFGELNEQVGHIGTAGGPHRPIVQCQLQVVNVFSHMIDAQISSPQYGQEFFPEWTIAEAATSPSNSTSLLGRIKKLLVAAKEKFSKLFSFESKKLPTECYDQAPEECSRLYEKGVCNYKEVAMEYCPITCGICKPRNYVSSSKYITTNEWDKISNDQ